MMYLRIIILVAVLSAVGGAYKIFTDMQERIGDLRENNAKLEQTAATNQETIYKMQEDALRLQKANADLQKNLQDSERYKDGLQSKLQKHNLAKLSHEKPAIIEERINAATAKVFAGLVADSQ